MSVPDPLGFAIVGCGMIARFHVRALAAIPGTKVAALVDRPERLMSPGTVLRVVLRLARPARGEVKRPAAISAAARTGRCRER